MTGHRIGEKGFFFGHLLLSLALAAMAYPAHAAGGQKGAGQDYFEYDESLTEKWRESKLVIPPFPNEQDLLPVTPQPTDTLRIYIDRASYSRGSDRVARFTLVVESPSGSRSVFFDGIRCETREYKTYAIGTADNAFSPVKQAAWRRITQPAINAFRHRLYRDIVCDAHASARTPEDFSRAMAQQPR